MVNSIKLRDICHARSGDKGDTVNIGLIVYNPAHFDWVLERVTAAAVAEYIKNIAIGPVKRYKLPKINAINFVVHKGLGGGVTRTLNIDGHGKAYGAILLEMAIEAPPNMNISRSTIQPILSKQQTIQSDKCLRLGSCSAYENDHLDAAVALAESGKIDYLIFDCLSEKTISEANLRKIRGDIGYDVFLEEKLRAVLPGSIRHGVKLIANAGAADVEGAARVTTKVCQELGLSGVKVCYVLGDNVLNLVKNQNPIVRETGEKISTFGDKLISAHVYEGAETIVQSLGRGADIVLTGRAGDSAQFLAAMIHEHGWSFNDQDLIGKGLGIGHLLECAGQATGGYHADPNIKKVPNLEFLGFPIANVYPNGDAIITKLPDTGGIVNTRTVTEQLVYEIDDPANYIHTDGIVDFTTTEITEIGKNQVLVSKTTGHSRPQNLKVVIGVLEGFVGMGRAVYCGSRAYDKARLAGEVVVKRMSTLYGVDSSTLQVDIIGANAIFNWDLDLSALKEVELRITGRFKTRQQAWKLMYTVSELPCNGPTGIAWGRPLDQGGVEEIISLYTLLLPQEAVRFSIHEIDVNL